MTTTSEPTATAVALPLTTFQRIMLRDLLHESWRAHVVNITNLAVRFHTREEPAVAARLAAVRRQLVDVESAPQRLDFGSYRGGGGGGRRIPLALLEAAPPR